MRVHRPCEIAQTLLTVQPWYRGWSLRANCQAPSLRSHWSMATKGRRTLALKKILSRSKLSSINYLIIGKKSNIYTASLFFNIFSQIKIFSMIVDIISTIRSFNYSFERILRRKNIYYIYLLYYLSSITFISIFY